VLNSAGFKGKNKYNSLMKGTFLKKSGLVFLILFSAVVICEAQRNNRSIRNPEREMFGRSLNSKTIRYKESPSIVRAKKKQAANQKKLKKEYAAYVKSQRKRAVKIQSPEVQTRMKENRKEIDQKYREKRKKRTEMSKKAGKKYE
jgi:hypothetical protein